MPILNTPSRIESRRSILTQIEAKFPKPYPSTKIEEKRPQSDYIVATNEYSGLGFAKMIKDSGKSVILAYKMKDDENEPEQFALVGNGIVDKVPLEEAVKKYPHSTFIWDRNHDSKIADSLRKRGVKVFGGHEISDRMEHDRQFAAKIVQHYGLNPPTTFEFSSRQEGLSFLEQNKDKAYVFKPNDTDDSWATRVPESEKDESANKEIQDYIKTLGNKSGTYILQERKKGVEANFELWFYNGNPFFAFLSLECKRKLNKDMGELVGCAMDLVHIIPINSLGIKETIGKLIPFYKKINYTGFADANVIISDREAYFLEVCNRLGYSSHPNLFMSLSMDPFHEIISDFISGKVEGMEKRFRRGFGASVTLYIDHKNENLPLYVSGEVENKFYHYDAHKKGGNYFLSGYANEVGVITGHGYTIKDAAEDVYKNADKINFPTKGLRTDLAGTDYPDSLQKRYEALVAMKYLNA